MVINNESKFTDVPPLSCRINPLRVLITFEMYAHARRHNGS